MKKLLCLLLVIAMVALPLIACADNTDDGKTPGGNTPNNPADTGNAAEDKFQLPANFSKYDNEPFTIIFETKKNWGFYEMDWDEDPGESDAYGHALYVRNQKVEEMLGIEILSKPFENAESTENAFKTDVESSAADYQAMFNTLQFEMQGVVAGNMLSFDNLPYINQSAQWWNQDCFDQLSILGKSYVGAGDIMISDKEVLWAVYFMKNRIAEANLEDPYELVHNNEWTWDKMIEMGDAVDRDDNNDDLRKVGTDIFGLNTHSENWPASWESAGLKLIEMDKEGVPTLAWGTEEFQTVHEDIAALMGNENVVGVDTPENIQASFKNNKTLFCTEVIAFVRMFRESENNFGILPYPKYSSDIDRYYTYVALNSAALAVGYATPMDQYDFVSLVLEAMAAEGRNSVRPVYIDEQLKSRYADDEDSAEMVEIIFDYRCYDMAAFLPTDYSGIDNLKAANANPSRLYTGQKGRIKGNLDKLVQTLIDRESE